MEGNDMDNKKTFMIPEAEIIIFNNEDIIANASQYLGNGTDFDEELP